MIEWIKNWIIERDFIQDAITGAYRQGQRIAEEEKVRTEIASLLGSFDEKLILTIDSKAGKAYIGGELVDPGRLNNLKQEAEFIVKTDLWLLINETLKKVTQDVMFNKSENFEDMRNGKSILYTLSFQNNVIKVLRSYKQPGK